MTMINEILAALGYAQPLHVSQFHNQEDGEGYQVWRIDYPERSFVLKKGKGEEVANYRTYFPDYCCFAPRLFGEFDGYILMEYVPGNDLMRCNRADLTLALDALVAMAECRFGETAEIPVSRLNRRKFLLNSRLEAAYDAYLTAFSHIPSSLCHDDLLPFNVIISGDRAIFIDWEVAGILPYPTALARLIAHAEEDENAFFYMNNTDKSYAIDYFYEHFAEKHGISHEDYQRHLDLCLFHEYCEWIYVGNKYEDTGSERYRKYCALALKQAEKLGF